MFLSVASGLKSSIVWTLLVNDSRLAVRLIQPQAGEVLLAADYRAEEIAVAAGLSGDQMLLQAYEAGDPYLELGTLAGMIQPGMEEGQVRQIRKLGLQALAPENVR